MQWSAAAAASVPNRRTQDWRPDQLARFMNFLRPGIENRRGRKRNADSSNGADVWVEVFGTTPVTY